jgi:hypothetical protein
MQAVAHLYWTSWHHSAGATRATKYYVALRLYVILVTLLVHEAHETDTLYLGFNSCTANRRCRRSQKRLLYDRATERQKRSVLHLRIAAYS